MYIWRLFTVLRLNVRTWGYLCPAYVCSHNVPVPTGSGRYIVVSEPRFTPGVGNHLGQYSGPYQQCNQIQIQTCLYLNLGFQRRVQEYHVSEIHSLTLFYSLLIVVNQKIWFPSCFLSISLFPIRLALVHYTNGSPEFIIDIRVAQRKRRVSVTFRLWGYKSCPPT